VPAIPGFTPQQAEVLIGGIGDALGMVRQEYEGKIAALEARIAMLEGRTPPAELLDRVAALEARPELKYLGVWTRDTRYAEGSAVTDHGSVWIAKEATGDRPPGNGWQLAVQSNKNGHRTTHSHR
jgi:hypothetical protein